MSKEELTIVKIDSTASDSHLNINEMNGGQKAKEEHESESEISDITTSSNSEVSHSDKESIAEESEDTDSIATTELIKLAEDPLYLVLGQFLVNKNKENIAEVLENINNNLSKITKYLEVIAKKN